MTNKFERFHTLDELDNLEFHQEKLQKEYEAFQVSQLHSIILKSLDKKVGEDQIRAMFKKYGEIVRVDLKVPKKKVGKWKNSGIAFVHFKKPIDLNVISKGCSGKLLGGKPFKTEPNKPKKK